MLEPAIFLENLLKLGFAFERLIRIERGDGILLFGHSIDRRFDRLVGMFDAGEAFGVADKQIAAGHEVLR